MKTPWNGFTASDCHFCDEWSIGLARQLRHVHEPSTHSSSEALIVTERQFYKHVGRHMEQLSLFALPKQYLENHNTLSESSSTSNTGENSEVLGSQHKIIDFAAPKEQIEQPIDIRRFIERTKREEAERPDKLEGEIELLKQNAVEAAAIQAREDVERAAAEKLKKTKEEHEKVLKKHIEAEEEAKKKKKEAEEMVMKLRPADEDAQPPIEFKDALGRKFFFPWKYCKTWKGIDDLIQQAFLHVEDIGEHVAAGHYDLVGPGDAIILPRVWETLVKPGWSVTMHMSPMHLVEEKQKNRRAAVPSPLMTWTAGSGKRKR